MEASNTMYSKPFSKTIKVPLIFYDVFMKIFFESTCMQSR